jgi:ribosomal protein S18 acetylase RimI-like enzyme
MKIEILNVNHKFLLQDFFLRLKPATYEFWNRFGILSDEKKALEVSETQVNLPKEQEIGFIAIDNGLIKGYSFLRFFPEKKIKRFTNSLGIVVDDEFQNQGIGKKLMNEMIFFSKTNGYKKVWLATYTDNKRALHIYSKLGFEVEGIFMYDEYFDDKPKHVVSMALFLDENLKDSRNRRFDFIKEIEK